MAFIDHLDMLFTIGKYNTTLDAARRPTVTFEKLYEVQGSMKSLRPHESLIADASQLNITHRIYMTLVDINGETLALERGMLVIPVVPYDHTTMKNLPSYSIVFQRPRRDVFYYVEVKEESSDGV